MAQAGEIRFDAIIDTSDYDSGVKDIQNATRKIEDSAEHSRRRLMVSGNWRTVWG